MLRPSGVINTALPDHRKLVTLMTGSSERRSLLITGDIRRSIMSRSLNIMPKTTEQHLIVCSGKSEAEVANNRRVHSRYCTVEGN